jgi:putative ABC transport system permease protein
VTLGDSVAARRIRVVRTTANLFPLLGVSPFLGRSFISEEDQPEVPRVIVLSYGMWQSEFGGDPNIIGQSVIIADREPVGAQQPLSPDHRSSDTWHDPRTGAERG